MNKKRFSNIPSRLVYSIIFILILLVVTLGVYAYGTNAPSSFGHSKDEVEGTLTLPSCSNGEILEYSNGNWVCGTDDVGTPGESIPTGIIAMFAGNCPTGWSEHTALRGKFPRGEPTGNSGSLGAGGSDNAIVVSHTHTVNPPNTGTTSGGSHSHVYTSPTLTSTGAGTQSEFSGVNSVSSTSTGAAGTHSHNVDIAQFNSGSAGSSGTGKNIPAYQEVIFCSKN